MSSKIPRRRGKISAIRVRYGRSKSHTAPDKLIYSQSFDKGEAVAANGTCVDSAAHRQVTTTEYDVPAGGWDSRIEAETLADFVEYEVPIEGQGSGYDVVQSPVVPAGTTPSDELEVNQSSQPPVAAEPTEKDAGTAPEDSGDTKAQEPTVTQPKSNKPATPKSGAIPEESLLEDIQSILSNKKTETSSKKPNGAQPKQKQQAPPAPPKNSQAQSRASTADALSRSEHAIFDRIAESMSKAKTYDLGSVALENRFDQFDEEAEKPKPGTQPPKPNPIPKDKDCGCSAHKNEVTQGAKSSEFLQDLDRMKQPASQAMSDEIPLDPGVGGQSIDERSMMPGDIILSTTDALISKAIRTATGSEVSHSAVYIGNGQIVEAVEEGVLLRSLDTAVEDDSLAVAYRHRDMTDDKAKKMVEFLKQQARDKRKYDTWGIVKTAPGQLARTICNALPDSLQSKCLETASEIQPGTNANDSFYCSELVLEALAHVGLSLSDVEPNWSSPDQILDLHYNGMLDYVGHLKV